MSRKRKQVLTALFIVAAMVATALGQQAQTPTPKPEVAPKPPDDYVEMSGFKGKIFEIKYRDPGAVLRVVAQLGSGFKGARMSYSDEFKTITVRDFPENLATIEEAIKRLDTPAPPQPDVELRMHLLIATNAEGASNQYPADLNDVVKQLQSTLSYKSYQLVASIVQRVKDGTRNLHGDGVAQVGPPIVAQPVDVPYGYEIGWVSLTPSASGAPTIQVSRFQFGIPPSPLGRAGIAADLTMRDGEKVVVGTASLKDRGMVLVISPRILK
jgi:hypothetical protein